MTTRLSIADLGATLGAEVVGDGRHEEKDDDVRKQDAHEGGAPEGLPGGDAAGAVPVAHQFAVT